MESADALNNAIVCLPRSRRSPGSWKLSQDDLAPAQVNHLLGKRSLVVLRVWAFSGPTARLHIEVVDGEGPLVEADGPQFEYLTLEERATAREALARGERVDLPQSTTVWVRTAKNSSVLPRLDEQPVFQLKDVCIEITAQSAVDFVELEVWLTPL